MAKKVQNEGIEKLMSDRRHGYARASKVDQKSALAFAGDYMHFMDSAKTEREAVAYAVQELKAAGFNEYNRKKKYKPGDKVYYNNRGKAMCIAVIGKNGVKHGAKIAAAHIDSPRLDLKPIPLYEANEMALLKTHYYGGIKKYQWTAIPLSMHGKIVKADGTEVEVNIGEKPGEPQFCITDILPHLGKDQMAKKLSEAFSGEDLNILVGSEPLSGEEKDAHKKNILKLLNDIYGIVEDDLVSAEIEFVPAFKAAEIGFDKSLIGAYGHDDRVCAYPAFRAALDCAVPESTVITVFADKEEVGSMGNTGLASEYLRYFVADLAQAEGLEARHVLSESECLSADVTAAYDPTYCAAFEPGNSCYINHGVGIAKYTGARGKSGSSDASAEFLGKIRRIFEDNDVLWQIGELGKVDQGGGGTVALEVARLNVDTIDIGVPVLSMHSPFEVVSKLDLFMTYKGIKAFFENK